MLASPIKTPRLFLRNISASDVGENYCRWLGDQQVTQFLEVRFQDRSFAGIQSFIEKINESSDSLLFGIYIIDTGQHIGNIKLGPCNWHHKRAEISLLIGDKTQWGKGYAIESIEALCKYGFNTLGLLKLMAGCYEKNTSSFRAFAKAGFRKEAFLPDYWLIDGEHQAQILLGLTCKKFNENVSL